MRVGKECSECVGYIRLSPQALIVQKRHLCSAHRSPQSVGRYGLVFERVWIDVFDFCVSIGFSTMSGNELNSKREDFGLVQNLKFASALHQAWPQSKLKIPLVKRSQHSALFPTKKFIFLSRVLAATTTGRITVSRSVRLAGRKHS